MEFCSSKNKQYSKLALSCILMKIYFCIGKWFCQIIFFRPALLIVLSLTRLRPVKAKEQQEAWFICVRFVLQDVHDACLFA